MPNIPSSLRQSAAQSVAELQKEAIGQSRTLTEVHDYYFEDYGSRLRREFYSHFVIDPDEDKTQRWDPLATMRDATFDRLLLDFASTVSTTAVADAEEIEENLDNALVEGHMRTLWMLARGGINVTPYVDLLPDRPNRIQLLLLTGVLSASWRERLARWQAEAASKGVRWLRSSVQGGRTLDETLQGLNGITKSFTGRVNALAEDELHRAFGLGAKFSMDAAKLGYVINEVWLTRRDAKVCPICEALHLTVTPLQPVTDSHPNCRCIKVPIPEGYRLRDLSYEDFLAELEPETA